MRRQLIPSLLMVVVFTVLTGVVYPLVMTAVGQGLFKDKVNGSLVKRNGTVVGSSLIGQNFTKPIYFHPRPSAAGKDGYDAAASSGSNKGPTNEDWLKGVAALVDSYRKENNLAPTAKVPVDAVTASASGLDPNISVANADLQAPRVAAARHVTLARVMRLVVKATQGRTFGFLGEPRVNVLELNLSLDAYA